MSAPNQSIVNHAARDLGAEGREVPEHRADEVLIVKQAGGICGFDLHHYNHGGFGPIQLREPMVLRYEVAGKITALGTDIEGSQVDPLITHSFDIAHAQDVFETAGDRSRAMKVQLTF